MENSSVFWNKIANWLTGLGFPPISEFEVKLVFIAVLLALLIILWFAFRKIRLWYWKTELQIDTLKNIEIHLQSVEERLTQDSATKVEKAEGGESLKDSSEASEEPEETEKESNRGILTAIGRSGKIYTEAELELQIRE